MSYDISHYRAYAIPVKQFFANSGNADITGSPIWLNINEFIHATGLSVPEVIDLEHPERSSWCSMGPGGLEIRVLSDAAAESLSKHQGDLSLSQLRKISLTGFEFLSKYKGQINDVDPKEWVESLKN
jgi:hypothetical protein